MKKNFKKVIAILMVACLAVACFASCGKTGDKEDSSKVDTSNATEATFDGELKVGVIGPLTGGAAVYGKAVQYGAEIAAAQINAAGGINGMKVVLQAEDDENNAEKSVNAYNTLKDWGMQVLVGTTTSQPCIAVAEKSAADGIFEITPSGSSTDCIKNDNVFQVCFTDPNQGIASADYISSLGFAKKLACIYKSDDPYSAGIHEKFVSECAAKGLEIVADEAFTDQSATDFSSQLSKAKSAGAELIFLPIYADVATSILTQAKQIGVTAKFFGCDGLDGILGIDGFDKSLAENVILLTPFASNATDDKTVAFVKAYRDAGYDEANLNQFAADSYDALFIVKKACEEAKVTKDMDAKTIGDALKAVITTITFDGVTGDGMKWQATGEVSKTPKGIEIKNGVYEPLVAGEDTSK